jgi:hypothetical protein
LIDPSPQQLWATRWLDVEETLLDSVRMVTKPRDAVVVLPYPICTTDWDMGESTVRLMIPYSGYGAEDEAS